MFTLTKKLLWLPATGQKTAQLAGFPICAEPGQNVLQTLLGDYRQPVARRFKVQIVRHTHFAVMAAAAVLQITADNTA